MIFMYYCAVNEDGLHAFPTAGYREGFCQLWNAKECNLDKRYNNVYYWSSNMCSAALPNHKIDTNDMGWYYGPDADLHISIREQARALYYPDVEEDEAITSAVVHKWLTAKEKEWMDTCADKSSFRQYIINKYGDWY